MTYKIDFELPGLPPTTNGAHGSWQKAAGDRKKWRLAAYRIAHARRPSAPLAKAKLTLTRYSGSRPDFDNLVISFKSIVDGLKDAKVLLDDKDAVVLERSYLWEKVPPKSGKIRIIVEEVA